MKSHFTILIVAYCLCSCESFVELDAPKTQIVSSQVFESDAGVRSALAGMYSKLVTTSTFASGGVNGVTAIAALSADELDNHSSQPDRIGLYQNELTPFNTPSSLWNEMYQTIYNANSIIEGLNATVSLTKPVSDQAMGEALFIRSFCYFYLTNLYGDVPLLLTTDYRVNRQAQRTPVEDVYRQLEQDLVKAETLLSEDYSFSDGERVEPNKWAAKSLLSRLYLYTHKWANAELQATSIIQGGNFSLIDDLNSVFLANSDEAIWQLKPVLSRFNTFDGPYFYGQYDISEVSITSGLLNSFENGDKRLTSWIANYSSETQSYNYAYKYKVLSGDQPVTEYQMVFRLGEQFLIRAEARAMQNNLSGSIDDVNAIRSRAGLELLDATELSQQEVLDAITQERRVELFIEWGHRWFDLKRTGQADSVLGTIKSDWQPSDALFPIDQKEINANTNLTQNP